MTALPLAGSVLLVATVIAAGIYDLRERRIPNWLVLTALILGLVLNVFLRGAGGLRQSALGMGLALLIYFPIYLLRGMGAGDVKFMAAIGAVVGPMNWLGVFFFTGLLGGLCAVSLLLFRGRLNHALWNVSFILKELIHFRAPHKGNRELDVRNAAAIRLPHGAVIALASLTFVTVMSIWGAR